MNKEDINTFSITFKCTNERYAGILKWLSYVYEVVSDSVIPNTKELYENDSHFKKLVKAEKEARRNKLDYINKHNK